jgi:hypothetical protein
MAQGVTVDFNANLARFTGAVDKAVSDLNRFQSNADRISAGVNKALSTLGVGISVGGIVAVAKASLDAQGRMGDLAASTKLAVTDLAGLSFAAEQSGADLDTLAKAVNKLTENQGKQAEKFAALGITAKSPLEAFGQLADVLNAIEDPQKRAAVATIAIGKSWEDAAPLLLEGSKGIADLVGRGKELSGITEEAAPRAQELGDKIDELSFRMRGIVHQTLAPMLPMLQAAADYFGEVGDKASASAPQVGLIGTVFQTVAVLGANVAFVFQGVGREIGGIAAQMSALATLDIKGFNAISEAMKEDAIRARAELDAFEQKIMNPGAAGAASGGTPKPRGRGASDSAIQAFIGGGAGGRSAAAEKVDDVTRALQGMAKEWSELGKSGTDLELFRLASMGATESQLELAKSLLGTIDATKAAADQQDRLNTLLDATPSAALEKTRQDMVLLADAMEKGLRGERGGITTEQYLEAVQARLGQVADEAKEVSNIGKELGMSFTSAFEDAVIGGKEAGEVIRALGQDIGRIMMRKTVTEPFADAVSGMVKGIDFGKLLSFDGGGSTGSGARSGGLDGKGGFLAMMHPQEDVIDRLKGGSSGGGTVNTFTVDMRGASVDAVNRLEQLVMSVNGSIERRAMNVMQQSRVRG